MKIGELPEDIYEVALQRANEYGKNIRLNLNDLDLTIAFDWSFTDEGVRIWSDVDIGDFDSFRAFHNNVPSEVPSEVPNKYQVNIKGTTCDVYDVLKAFDVRNPAIQHAIKKLLMPGKRGHKDKLQDLLEAKQSIVRAINLENE